MPPELGRSRAILARMTRLSKIPTPALREILADTEREAGPDSASARVLRAELNRRERKEDGGEAQ